MSETSVIAILASVGVILTGTAGADAAAFASAIQQGSPDKLIEFVAEHPESQLAPDALLLASQISLGRSEDEAVSTVNPELTCRLRITRNLTGMAVISWESTGAVALGLSPVGSPAGAAIPASGQREFEAGDFAQVTMTAVDAAGNRVRCWVALGGTDLDLESLASPGEDAAIVISV